MAGALVGGAFPSSFLNVLFDRMASPQVMAFFRGRKVNDGLLKRLGTTMMSVDGLLEDAEEKQITNTAVQQWLDQVKNAAYEADDLLDDIANEAQRLELEAEDQTYTGQTQKLLSFINPLEIMGLREIEEKLGGLQERLDYLVKQKDALGLINRNGENPSSHKTPTTSLVDESGVYGRDDDRKAKLKLFLSDNAKGKNSGVTSQRGETMAGALGGGAFLSAIHQVLFDDRMASPQVVDFLRGRKVKNGLLKRLATTMISVSRLLDDAEEKQITNTAVRFWLAEYKDAVYEADDFLDEIACEAQRQELEAEDQTFTGHVQKLLSFINPLEIMGLREIEKKLRGLQERLDYLVKQKDVLGLINRNGENPSPHKTPTTSLGDESGVYGRDDDREAILKLLLSDDANGKNPGVVPIVGMGGVGKTTLAQLVYNHRGVQEGFGLKAWACVSEDFSVLKLTKVILEELGSKTGSGHLNSPHNLLKEILQGKKFLLVLDDVWIEHYAEWDKLLTPLKFGAQGSKILVTTRNERVASFMRTVPTHHLKELTEDNCWSLFAKHAFRGENPTAHEELLEIGRAIARKCKGLPLAAVTLGRLLRTKRDVEEWKKILESNLWVLPKDNILPILRLSYHHLPSHLKQCFAYCAIFPKDYSFQKDELVRLWMAEGFLVRSVDDEMEKAGAECFDDLLSRSFFQHSSASPSSFVMHDLMHELATQVSGQFCFSSRLGEYNSCRATRRTRHLSLAVDTKGDFSSTKLDNIREAQLLRTFQTFPRNWRCSPDFYNEIFHILPTLGRLRVLSLSYCAGAAKMLCSNCKLKHLRYLDLSWSDLVTLPEEVSSLLNLQTLILKCCLKLASLPDIGNLKRLRHVNLQGTRIERLPASLERLINLRYLNITGTPLKEMPPHIGQLTKLQTLTAFLVGRQSETSIKELGKLRHLRGELHIGNLQNVVDARDAVEANLKGRRHLDKLMFTWDGDTHDPQHITSTLEKLEPNRNVKDLQIDGYGGLRFPEWVGESSFSNIVSLKLSRCTNCTSLPPLGQLASLEDLSIEAFDKVVTVGSEFYGNCTAMKKPFESLKKLRFERMPKWREWISDEGSREAFPLLEVLYIRECPNLTKALPSHHLTSLKELNIIHCPRHESMPGGLPSSLSTLAIHHCPMLCESCEREKGSKYNFPLAVYEVIPSLLPEQYAQDKIDLLAPSVLPILPVAEWSTIVSQNKIALPANQQNSDPNFLLRAWVAYQYG